MSDKSERSPTGSLGGRRGGELAGVRATLFGVVLAPQPVYVLARNVHIADVLCRADGSRGQAVSIATRPGMVLIELVGGGWWALEPGELVRLEHRPW
jgi:hypothetical protein